MLDAEVVRKDFPIFETLAHGRRLVYLDSAATAQKPRYVIDRMIRFYETENANVHRGIYELGEKATAAFEAARQTCANFIGARDPRSIVFTRGTTESINLVRFTWAKENVKAGDEILITEMEHHSNLIPWQLLVAENGAVLRHLPIDDEGLLRLDLLDEFITDRTKLVALSLMSNVLGTINPVRTVAECRARRGGPGTGRCRPRGAASRLRCQRPRRRLRGSFRPQDVRTNGGRAALRTHRSARRDASVPRRRRDDPGGVGRPRNVGRHPLQVRGGNNELGRRHRHGRSDRVHRGHRDGVDPGPRDGSRRLRDRPSHRCRRHRLWAEGPDPARGTIAFNLDGVHPHDMATIVDQEGVCIRAESPLCATVDAGVWACRRRRRASLYIYNDERDIDALIDALAKAKGWFA